MKFLEIYRRDKFGKMLVIGHLESNGAISHYCTIVNSLESGEDVQESHKILYTKNNKLDVFEPLTKEKIEEYKAMYQFNKSVRK